MPKGLKGFQKGHIAWNKGRNLYYTIWNKGKKCPSISKKLKGRKLSLKTKLKMLGRPAWNKGKKGKYSLKDRVSIGIISIRKDVNGKKRNWIKIAYPYKWIQLSHYIYQKLTGKNTYNQIIHHKDKNSLNDNINNLQLVSRSEHCKLHQVEINGRFILK